MKIVYLLMRWLFELVVLLSRGDRAKDAELLVLRHENAVLRRNTGRVRYEPADRAWFAALAQFVLCVPKMSSTALTSRVALPGVRP